MKAERAQRIIDALQIDGTTENSEQTKHDGAQAPSERCEFLQLQASDGWSLKI
jgi:hypothetical protein